MVSKALDKSKKIPMVNFFSSKALEILSTRPMRAKAVDRFLRNPNYLSVSKLLHIKNDISLLYISFSRIFEKTGNTDMGL